MGTGVVIGEETGELVLVPALVLALGQVLGQVLGRVLVAVLGQVQVLGRFLLSDLLLSAA